MGLSRSLRAGKLAEAGQGSSGFPLLLFFDSHFGNRIGFRSDFKLGIFDVGVNLCRIQNLLVQPQDLPSNSICTVQRDG